MNHDTLRIDGEVKNTVELTRQDLAGFPNVDLVSDVSQLDPRRSGEAVMLDALLRRATPDDSATHVTLHSSDGFSASIPLAEVHDRGIVLFQNGGASVPTTAGGPFRFLIPDAAECKTAELDACANVKGLARIELTIGRGRDTR